MTERTPQEKTLALVKAMGLSVRMARSPTNDRHRYHLQHKTQGALEWHTLLNTEGATEEDVWEKALVHYTLHAQIAVAELYGSHRAVARDLSDVARAEKDIASALALLDQTRASATAARTRLAHSQQAKAEALREAAAENLNLLQVLLDVEAP